METAKRTAILLILALLATTIAQSDDKPLQDEPSPASKPQVSQTRTASCLVKVTADPAVVPLDMQTIQYLLESSAVAGKAAREVLGITSLQGPRPFQITIEQLTGAAGGYGGYYGGVGLPTTNPGRSSSRSRTSQPGYQQTAKPATSSRRPTSSSSSRSSSSIRPSSNQQTSYGYSTTAKPHPTPTQPKPMTMSTEPRVEGILGEKALISGRWRKVGDNIGDAKVLEIKPTHVKVEWQGQQKTLFPVGGPTTRSASSATSDPYSSQYSSRYSSPGRSGDAYGNAAFPGGSYGSSYSRGSSTSTGSPYDAGSSSGYYSYSRTPGYPAPRTTSRSSAPTRPTSAAQTIFFRLQVDISEASVKPAAKELLDALVANLHNVLEFAAGEYGMSIERDLEFAERERDETQAQLLVTMAQAQREVSIPTVESDPANVTVKEQLNEIVDLSALTPEMAFSEALNEIKNSVEPPLQIVVLWRDLNDNLRVEPTTEINMNGLSQVPLHKGLSLLLRTVVDPDEYLLTYSISNGIITIASKASIPRDMVTVVYDIPGLIYSGSTAMELADVIVQTIEPDSWFENGGLGEGEIAPYLGSKLAVLQTVDVHRKIKNFLADTVENDAPLAIPLDIPPETFLYEKQELQRQRRMLEMDVARLKARSTAIEQAVARISTEVAQRLGADSVTTELEKILEINANLLAVTKKRYESGTVSGAEIQQVEEKLARARIELARRREELSKAAGGDELAKFNSELTSLAIDLAEKTAELQVVNTQLGQAEGQLAMATTLNTQLSELRYAQEAFDAAQQRVSQLKARLANLVRPTVTVIGAN